MYMILNVIEVGNPCLQTEIILDGPTYFDDELMFIIDCPIDCLFHFY